MTEAQPKKNFCFQAESRVMREWAEKIRQTTEALSASDQNEQAVYKLNLLATLIGSYPELIRGATGETQTLI